MPSASSEAWGGPYPVLPFGDWRGTFVGGTTAQGVKLPCDATYCLVAWPGKRYRAFLERDRSVHQQNFFGSLTAGQENSNGLMYMRNRYYNPLTGAFTQDDPIGLAGGLNTYGYAAGNPVSYSDPYGLCPENDTTDCTAVVARLRAQRGSEFESAANTLESSGYAVYVVPGSHQRLFDPHNDNRDGNARTFVGGIVNRGRKEMFLTGDFSASDFLLTAVHEVDHVGGGDEGSATLAGWRAFLQMTPRQQNAAPRNQYYFFQVFNGAETGLGSNRLIENVREPRRCGTNDMGCPQAY